MLSNKYALIYVQTFLDSLN